MNLVEIMKKIFSWRPNFFDLVLLPIAAIICFFAISNLSQNKLPSKADIDMQAKSEIRAENAKKLAEKKLEKNRMCLEKSVCKIFAQARQDCATAGNFDTCMEIKMGSYAHDTQWAKYYCKKDGTLEFEPNNIPNDFICFFKGN